MSVISQPQYDRLAQIGLEAKDIWKELALLEEEAYSITQEEDKTGYTSDLVLQSNADVSLILEYLGITVKEINE